MQCDVHLSVGIAYVGFDLKPTAYNNANPPRLCLSLVREESSKRASIAVDECGQLISINSGDVAIGIAVPIDRVSDSAINGAAVARESPMKVNQPSRHIL